MEKKTLKTRIQHKIDTYAHWKAATNFYPLKGELIIYTTDQFGNEKIGFKIGNGDNVTNVDALPFVSLGEIEGGEGLLQQIQADWNQDNPDMPDYIKNKPFGEDSQTVITWDGNLDKVLDILPIDNSELSFYLLDYNPINVENIIESSFLFHDGTQQGMFGIISQSDIVFLREEDLNSYVVLVEGVLPLLASASEAMDVTVEGVTLSIPSSGLWFLGTNDISSYMKQLKIGYSIKQIDPKYIPINLNDYYNKTEVNDIVKAITEILTNQYYKKSEVYTKDQTSETLINYAYSKNEIDNMFTSFDEALFSIIGNGVLS